jgi:hypothetical protein
MRWDNSNPAESPDRFLLGGKAVSKTGTDYLANFKN